MRKNIVITGTSRGIGLELVQILAREGHQILALSRNEKPIVNLKLPNVTALSCDLAEANDIKKAVSYVKQNWETVDVLIHNAGLFLKQDFAKTDMQAVKKVFDVNVFAVFQLTHQLLPFMQSQSHVVTISSMGGVQGSVKFPGLAAYSSSKAAIITFTELLAEEHKESGPSFNVLALGAVQTEMLSEAFPGFEAKVSAEEMGSYIAHFALTGHQFYNGKLLQVANTTP